MQDNVQQRMKELNLLIGSNMRYQRVLAGFSQEKLGAALGVTFQQVQKNERGINNISAARLKLAADALRVPVACFYGVSGLTDEQIELPRDTAEIVQLAGTLTDGQRKAIKQLLRSIAPPEYSL